MQKEARTASPPNLTFHGYRYVEITGLDEAARMLDAMGDTETAARYREKAADARAAWNELFIDAGTGKTVSAKGVIQDTQASYATPLRFGVISEEKLPRVLEHYLRTIEAPEATDSDGLSVPAYTITTGFNATGNVLPGLRAARRNLVLPLITRKVNAL